MKIITTYNTDLKTAEQGFAISLLRTKRSCRAYCKQSLHYLCTRVTYETDEKASDKRKGIYKGTKKAFNEIIQGIES